MILPMPVSCEEGLWKIESCRHGDTDRSRLQHRVEIRTAIPDGYAGYFDLGQQRLASRLARRNALRQHAEKGGDLRASKKAAGFRGKDLAVGASRGAGFALIRVRAFLVTHQHSPFNKRCFTDAPPVGFLCNRLGQQLRARFSTLAQFRGTAFPRAGLRLPLPAGGVF